MAENQDSTTESVIGRAKEAAGAALGADAVRDEGRAQQNKAEAQDEEARKEQELKQARAQRQAHESQEDKNKPS